MCQLLGEIIAGARNTVPQSTGFTLGGLERDGAVLLVVADDHPAADPPRRPPSSQD
jgi:hypothetical protein